MACDITKLSEDELLELNRRVVERLQFIRSAKSLTPNSPGFRSAWQSNSTPMMAG